MKNYLEKCKHSFTVLLLPMISYGLLGPLEIFFGNEKDFNFWYTDFWGRLLLISLAVWLVLGLLVACLPQKINKIVNAFILGIGIASYIQNMFMNIKLSEDDGSPMRWESLGNFPIINLMIWIVILSVVIVVCVLLKEKWGPLSMGVSGFFSAIQLVAVVSLLLTSIGGGKESGDLQMSGRDQLKVASKDNVIVFVLDTYGTVQMENALQQYPDMLDGLQDFTYYNNADCHYYCTFPSMTNMLTGENFNFDATLSQEWMADAWASERAEKFYTLLHEEGYACRLYSGDVGYVYGSIDNLANKYDNVCGMEKKVDTNRVIKLMVKMSVYRYVPYVLKPRFEVLTLEYDNVVSYVGDVGIVDDNAMFYQMLTEQSLSVKTDEENALIIQHLFGTHKPYTLDEHAAYVEAAEVNQTARGLFVIINEYLEQLKTLDKYDDATIIITADHGSWYGLDAQPIFFIKQKHEKHGEMQINSAPISLDDFQPTVLDVLGQNTEDFGTSIFDWEPGDRRERSVYMRMNDENYPEVQGSSFNVYYGYTYSTDKKELDEKMTQGPDVIIPATPW